jgi:uncharacterized protein (TIGR01777 family)
MGREIVITGANGWIGGHVGETLAERGWSITGVSRTPEQARENRPGWAWIGTGPELEEAVTRTGAVLNLCGRHPFEQPWTPEYVAAMRESRIGTTRRIVAALAASDAPDRVLVSGSGYPIYGDAGDLPLGDDAAPGRGLVCGDMDADWEQAAAPAAEAGARLVLLRLGLTLGSDGGPFLALRGPFDQGAGVVLGTGRQWVPWIHLDDAVRLIVTLVEDPSWSGPVNVVAPEPVRHAELAAALGEALGVPCETTVPPEAVTAQLGGVGELLLASQRMVPARVLATGFGYRVPEITGAVKALVAG